MEGVSTSVKKSKCCRDDLEAPWKKRKKGYSLGYTDADREEDLRRNR